MLLSYQCRVKFAFLISDFYVGIEVSGADPVGEEAAIAYTHDFNNDNS